MKLAFDLSSIVITEFGVGRDDDGDRAFVSVPVDGGVQDALADMVQETISALSRVSEEPQSYQPSEKYSSLEHLSVPTDDDLAAELNELHKAKNIDIDTDALEEPDKMFCYFVRFSDAKRRRLTAVRRATQFKGVLKSRLVRLLSDTLRLVQDQTFKLDRDFDLLIDSTAIHILRPSGFEFVGRLQEAIRAAVSGNIEAIKQDLHFVDLANIEQYAATHTRAARHLASIRSQRETKDISLALLKKACKTHSVEMHTKNGVVRVANGSEMGFLDVLDRRRYELELVEGSPERYKASSRQKVIS